jgi:Cu+-exporting ATPase
MGMEGYLGNQKIHVGNKALMEKKLVQIDALQQKSGEYLAAGNIVLFVAIDGNFVGLIILHDEHDEKIKKAVKALHSLGISVALMTADHRETALALAEKLGIERVIAGISADEKPQEIAKLLREEKFVAKLGRKHHHKPAFDAADIAVLHGEGREDQYDLQVESLEHLLEEIRKAKRQ